MGSRTALLALTIAWCCAGSAAEPGVIIDLDHTPLAEAAEFIGRLSGTSIELGPGAAGSITLSSPRALTFGQLMSAFEGELARNGMVAIKRGRAMLIVPALAKAPPPSGPIPAPPTASVAIKESPIKPAVAAKLEASPTRPKTIRYQPFVGQNRIRVESLAKRLNDAGVMAQTMALDEDGERVYALIIDVAYSDAAHANLRATIARLGLEAIIALPPNATDGAHLIPPS